MKNERKRIIKLHILLRNNVCKNANKKINKLNSKLKLIKNNLKEYKKIFFFVSKLWKKKLK